MIRERMFILVSVVQGFIHILKLLELLRPVLVVEGNRVRRKLWQCNFFIVLLTSRVVG
jgi:hypothetical protein